MNEISVKPKYLSFTDRWATKVVMAWSCMSLIIGVTNIELIAGIAFPLMTVLMFFASQWLIKFVLEFQKANPYMPQRYFGLVVKFFWALGLYFCGTFVFRGFFGDIQSDHGSFFLMVGSVFPLGVSLGASKVW